MAKKDKVVQVQFDHIEPPTGIGGIKKSTEFASLLTLMNSGLMYFTIYDITIKSEPKQLFDWFLMDGPPTDGLPK